MIRPERIHRLNRGDTVAGRYVLYWMQASQRAEWNHALEYAIRSANELGQPLVAYFGLTSGFPEANLRHYAFMLEGLKETSRTLEKRGIRFVLRLEDPSRGVAEMGRKASMVIVDRGYLRVQRRWRTRAARNLKCPLVEVESDAVVPVDTSSDKEEYAAATIRRRIHRHLPAFLVPLRTSRIRRDSLGLRMRGEKLERIDLLLKRLRVRRSIRPVGSFTGGTAEAERLLRRFIRTSLKDYADLHSEPGLDVTSFLSPYLHFGQISPLQIALAVRAARGRPRASKDAFLEELIVRRELSLNFVRFNPHYDAFACLPDWAQKTLQDHARDKRPYTYSLKDLERAATHDPYWNAAMQEMVHTGFMHNYMRMYWGKKILEWTRSPKKAFETALHLNNRYFLDGRDPNSFASVAWCFGKHDRPWTERPIFGKVRYMNARGLERKFDMDAYLRKVDALKQHSRRTSA